MAGGRLECMYTDTMIGTQTMADLIATAHIVEDEEGSPVLSLSRIPEGFSWLGSGSERHAFLGPDGVVYKRTLCEPGAKYSNSREHTNFLTKAHTLPVGVRFAACELYFSGDVDVLAMEWVDGVGEENEETYPEETFYALIQQGWTDIHEYNVGMDGDTLVMIDYAR